MYARLGLLLTVVLAVAIVARDAPPACAWSYPTPLNEAVGDWFSEFSPQVASDGLGNWVAVWYRTAPPYSGPDSDVLVARSTNNGASWTAEAILNSNDTEYYDDRSPDVTTDGAGNWVAVWCSEENIFDPNLNAYIGGDYDILLARSTDNGASWSDSVALNTNAADDPYPSHDYGPHVAADGQGNWVTVWPTTNSLDDTIGTDLDILVAHSTDNGVTWTAPTVLNSNADKDSADDRDVQVTTDGGGNWVTVWGTNEQNLGGYYIGNDYDVLISRSTDNGTTWTDPAVLNPNAAADSGSDWDPQVATDGGGNWVAVWDSNEANVGSGIGTDKDILVVRSTDGGANWTGPAALNTNAATDSRGDGSPQVTSVGGSWVAVWSSAENLLDPNLNDYIGEDSDILLSSSWDNGASWTDPAVLNPNAAADSGSDWDAQVATDGGGNWVAVWNSDDDLGGTIGTDSDILSANESPAPAVGGIAELPEVSRSAGRSYVALAGVTAAALVALAAGGWYARRRLA
jgi:hypothetical protein